MAVLGMVEVVVLTTEPEAEQVQVVEVVIQEDG